MNQQQNIALTVFNLYENYNMKKINSKTLTEVGVTHNPKIKKQVMIASGEFDNILTFGRAIFQPNQSSSPHTHKDVNEIFFILSGKGLFHTENNTITVEKDDYISIPAGEKHWQSNPYKEPLELLYFIIETS